MSSVTATYRLHAPRDQVDARAEALRLEQTVELPRGAVPEGFVSDEILPRLVSIESEDETHHRIALRFSAASLGDDAGQLLNVLFGNSSLQPDVALVDLDVAASAGTVYGGPRFGVSGLRELTGIRDRPLTSTALKPVGLSPAQLGSLCETFAVAGIDLIKDDHGLGDHHFCRFEERLDCCLAAIDRAAQRTGRAAVYAPSLAGPPAKIERHLDLCRARGVSAVLMTPMLCGAPLVHQLVESPAGLAVIAHPALAGATRIAPQVLLGTIFRLLGADASIFPHDGGRFAHDARSCAAIAKRLREPCGELRPALPVPAGGMSVERAEEVVRFYGRDAMLLIGGSLYMAGSRLEQRSRQFVDAVTEAAATLGDAPGPGGDTRRSPETVDDE
jgi:ribulose-bisphosphate carboxylase large chain